MVVTSEASYVVICSSKKISIPSPRHGGQRKVRGEGGPKGGNFRGGRGLLTGVFFQGVCVWPAN